jgi:hypothetical protein
LERRLLFEGKKLKRPKITIKKVGGSLEKPSVSGGTSLAWQLFPLSVRLVTPSIILRLDFVHPTIFPAARQHQNLINSTNRSRA